MEEKKKTRAEERLEEIFGHRGAVTIQLLLALSDGAMRFGELREQGDGISPKTLATNLRALEHNGLVNRMVFAEIPPRVVYSLTEAGEELAEPLWALRDWCERRGAAEEEER